MCYKLREGIVLVKICGDTFLIPSERSGLKYTIPVYIDHGTAALFIDEAQIPAGTGDPGTANAQKSHAGSVSADRELLNKLLRIGFVVEADQ